ncbi:MAG: hypothetical protein ACYC1Y_00840 [Minisyncoccota bacterium]
MTPNARITDEQLGQYYRKTIAIAHRLDTPLAFEKVMHVLDLVHDNLLDKAITVSEPVLALFEPITTIDVREIASFIPQEKFREGSVTDGVKIAETSSDFKRNFLIITQTHIAPTTIRIQKLKKQCAGREIMERLGAACEIMLAHVWELLKAQGAGQPGPLLVNSCKNIAYIRDKKGCLQSVYAKWDFDDNGWKIFCLPAGSSSPSEESGSHVISL